YTDTYFLSVLLPARCVSTLENCGMASTAHGGRQHLSLLYRAHRCLPSASPTLSPHNPVALATRPRRNGSTAGRCPRARTEETPRGCAGGGHVTLGARGWGYEQGFLEGEPVYRLGRGGARGRGR
ncbi:unnamed protein product, partial [Discosporangium mesarthrocarpum]